MTYHDEPPSYPPRHGPARWARNDDWARGVLRASEARCFHPGVTRGKPAAECPECIATVLVRRAHR